MPQDVCVRCRPAGDSLLGHHPPFSVTVLLLLYRLVGRTTRPAGEREREHELCGGLCTAASDERCDLQWCGGVGDERYGGLTYTVVVAWQ